MGRTSLMRVATVGLLAAASLVTGSGPAGADVLVVDAASLTVPGFTADVGIVEMSPQTPVGGITGPLRVVPDVGCAAGDFAGFPAGSIALIFDGDCSIELKHLNAAAAGAVGVVIAKNGPGPLEGAFANPGVIPTGIISQVDGAVLAATAFFAVATLDLRYHFEPETEYEFSGFMGSVDDAPTVNTGKAGRTYALTWQLTRAGEPVTDLVAITSVTSKSTGCGAFTDDPADALEATASGSAGLRYDDQAGTFVYNWKTPKGRACYTLFITLDDGQVFPAYFDLR